MVDARWTRIGGVIILLVILAGLCLGFGSQTTVQTASSLPGNEQLGYEAGRYVGERVQITGTVTSTEPVVIAAEYDYYADGARHSGTTTLTIRDIDQPVTTGSTLQVYGILASDTTITALNTLSIPARNYLYMYTVSFLAGLWVLGRLLSHWQLNPQREAITKRPTPHSLPTRIRDDTSQRGEE